APGDSCERPSAGGGGFGDPLDRTTAGVVEDVIDGCGAIDRAAKDYGGVSAETDAEHAGTEAGDAGAAPERAPLRPGGHAQPDPAAAEVHGAARPRARARIRSDRAPCLDAAPAEVARRYREDEITVHDVIRRYGVVLDWGTGELLEKSTGQFRESMRARSAAH